MRVDDNFIISGISHAYILEAINCDFIGCSSEVATSSGTLQFCGYVGNANGPVNFTRCRTIFNTDGFWQGAGYVNDIINEDVTVTFRDCYAIFTGDAVSSGFPNFAFVRQVRASVSATRLKQER